MANTLIIRYQRIGDALIALPLILELAKTYKEDQFTVVTNPRFACLFELMPENVTFLPVTARSSTGMFRGISFLVRRFLFQQKIIRMSKKFDKIALLQFGSLEKKIYKAHKKKNFPIPLAVSDETTFMSAERMRNRFSDGLTMVDLHKNALAQIGYPDIQSNPVSTIFRNRDTTDLFKELGIRVHVKLIAIAPFSKEELKTYPLDKVEKVIDWFAGKPEKYKVLLFGGGNEEKRMGDELVRKYPNVLSLIKKVSYETEVLLLSKCVVTLSMDSSNMHLSALLGTPVISVWGGTLPKIGYYPMHEPKENALYLDLDCQPCSFFGNGKCTQEPKYKCFEIDPRVVIKKMEDVISS